MISPSPASTLAGTPVPIVSWMILVATNRVGAWDFIARGKEFFNTSLVFHHLGDLAFSANGGTRGIMALHGPKGAS
jgi:hypothetical protein